MKNFLPLFLLGLLMTSSLYSQECILANDDPNFPVICFSDATLGNPAEIFLTETEFNNFDPNDFIDDFAVNRFLCNTTSNIRIIRNNNLRGQTISASRSNQGAILETIEFRIEELEGFDINPIDGFDVNGNGEIEVFQSESCDETLTLIIRAAAEPIPTLSQWGLMIFGLIILNFSCLFITKNEEILA